MREYEATIIRIIDGDTVEAELDLGFGIKYKSKLRFMNYDAPETYRPSCLAEKLAGTKAKDWLSKRLYNYIKNYNSNILDTVTLRTYKDRKGKYGRILCRIWINGVDIIQEMIDLGMIKKDTWK